MAKVKVILAADCYVGKQLRAAGEEVELPEEIAPFFDGSMEHLKNKTDDEPKPVTRRKNRKK